MSYFWTQSLFAEYRAYQLSIVNPNTGKEQTVLSTLDHIQYPDYYPLQSSESIYYVTSWMCEGNTKDFTPICPNPKENAMNLNEATPKP